MVQSSNNLSSDNGTGQNGAIVSSQGGGPITVPTDGAASPHLFGGGASGETGSTQQIVSGTLRYKWTIALSFVLIAGVALPSIWSLVVPQYKANAVVRVSPLIQRIVFPTEESGMVPLYTSYLNTQVQMILNPKVLNRVLDRPDIQRTAWYKDDKPTPFKATLPKISRLLKGLSARPRPRTELIDVAMKAKDPADAKLIVNAVVEEYENHHNETFRESGNTRFKTLTDELNSLKSEIDGELALMASISKQLGTTQPQELRKELRLRLSELEAQLHTLERTHAMTGWELTRFSELKADTEEQTADASEQEEDATKAASLPTDPLFARDSEWLRLREQVQAVQHRLKLDRERHGDAHPKIKDLIATVEYAKQRLGERETQLSETAALPGAVPLASPGEQVLVEDVLKHNLDRTQYEGALLKKQIHDQQSAVVRTGDLAHELFETEEQISRKRELYQRVQRRLDELEMESNAPGRISVAARAMLPASPSKDQRLLLSAMAVFGGLAVGFGIAFLRHSLDSSLRQAEDVTAAVSIPFLGQLPQATPQELLDVSDGLLMESLRMVRTALLERVATGHSCSVLVTSPTSQTGKTSLTIMLGRSLAQLGKKVLLVDGDLRRASLTQRLGHESEMGLTTILNGQASWEQVVLPTEVPGVDIIPAGGFHSAGDIELMADRAFSERISQWKESYDFVILDSPPVLPVADARILARQVDGTILTIRASHSRRADAMDSLRRLRAAGGELFGTVLVGTEVRSRYYGAHGDYGYYYSSSGRESRQLAEVGG